MALMVTLGDSPLRDRADKPEQAVVDELRHARGRLAIVADSGGAGDVLERFAAVIGSPVARVGRLLAECGPPPTERCIRERLTNRHVISDIEVLFWRPCLDLDPLALFRRLARSGPPVIIHWPGRIDGRRARFSAPGRADHYDAPLSDALVLRPRPVSFPDEVPYDLERVPA